MNLAFASKVQFLPSIGSAQNKNPRKVLSQTR